LHPFETRTRKATEIEACEGEKNWHRKMERVQGNAKSADDCVGEKKTLLRIKRNIPKKEGGRSYRWQRKEGARGRPEKVIKARRRLDSAGVRRKIAEGTEGTILNS